MYKFLLKLDYIACYYLRWLWNPLFVKKGGYKFGTRKEVDETMSGVFGKNILTNKTRILGWLIISVIEFVDMLVWTIIHAFSSKRRPYQDHCIASIDLFEDANIKAMRKVPNYYEQEANEQNQRLGVIKQPPRDPPPGGGSIPNPPPKDTTETIT